MDPDEFLDVSSLKLDQNDFYGTFDIVFHENPNIFWARDIVIEVDGETNKVNKIKYYTPFTKEELAEMKSKFNQGIQKAIDTINSNLTKDSSKFEKVKAIHDYLIRNNHYGSETCPEKEHPGIGHLGCKGQYIEHSAYGAFVETKGYGVVCEGFGTAFILLSEKFGIEAIFDAGPSKKASGGFHLWNYVRMEDKKWYLLDLTYDNGYLGEDEIAYNLFLVGKNDPAFNYKHDDYLSGLWNDLSKAQVYNIPEISNTSYIKFEVVYPDKSRNVFRNFNDLLDDLKTKDIEGKYTILLRDDYSLTKEEVQKLREYKAKPNQSFGIQSLDEDYMSKPYSLKSETNKIYFPMEVSISDISYDIANTYSEGKKITIGEFVEKSNTSNGNSIYLMAKKELDSINEVSIKSGSWEKIVGSYSEDKTNSSHNGTTNISISDGDIKEVILSQADNVKGNINVDISGKANIENFKYGENINLDKDKNIDINISGGKVKYFDANDKAISANTNINVTGGEVEGLMGPVVFSKDNNKNTTNINVTNGTVGMIVGGGSYDNDIKNNNDVVIDIKNIKNVDSITGKLYGQGNATIKVNSNITAGKVTDFDNLIIGKGNSLEITQDLNYNQMQTARKGLVEFLGSSKLILPEVPSTVGSLKSTGTLNKLIISKEEAYLNINEKQGAQGSPIGINYEKGLLPQNGDELLRYKDKKDINLNNFINEIGETFALYNDESTGSIRLVLDQYPIKVSYKNGDEFEFASLAEAIQDVENEQSENAENASEVTFSIYGEYEMTDEDLIKLESYSSADNQKFIFTSGEELAVLSTVDDVIFPVYNKLREIEFKNITLDFDNKNIFASGSHLIMDESVKMTNKSNIDLYGGLFETEVTNSKLTLNGGTFNNVYGGGSSLEGIVSNDVNITLGKNVLVKGNVYGGADSDKTGSKESNGTTTINLIGGTVNGDIIGGGKNDKSPVFNKIVINYGDTVSESATNVKNIYGLAKILTKGTSNNDIDINININKNAEFEILAGFSNVNVKENVILKVLNVLKYDVGISSNSEGKVKLSGGSNFYIPNAAVEDNRKIGKLETIGLNNIHIEKNKYLLIDGNINPIIGQPANISYYNGLPELDDTVVKFSNKKLTNNEHFKTNYKFNISPNLESGLLYLSEEPYEVRLYTDNNTLYKTDKSNESSKYTFEQGPKLRGKKFIKWKNKYEENIYYTVGQTIDLDNNISVIGVYEDIEEYTVTLKVDGIPYKTEYVEAGHSYTFTIAPPKPEKYFIGWTSSNVLSKPSTAMGRTPLHIQPGTTISVNSNLTYNADYGKEVKYEVDYGEDNGKVEDVYYEGGALKVPSLPPVNIKIPIGKVWGGFKAIIGGIGSAISSIFKPGSSVVIQPGIKLEAVWVDELTIKLDGEDGNNIKTEKIGKGFEYTFPKAPEIEDKEFLYWQDKSNANNKYRAGQKIEVNSNMELKAVYKNIKVVSIALDNLKEEKFTDLSSALNYAKNKEFKTLNIKLLENYSLKDADIKSLKDFNKNDVNFVIKGRNKDIELAISKSIMLSADTKFEDLVFDYGTSTSHGIYARGHKLEMGENVTMKSTGAPTLIGGDYKANVDKSEIIVKSGRYKDIYGGGFSDNSGVNGNINIELHKGEVLGDIYGGSHDKGKMSGGKTTIKLAGGSVGGLVVGTSRVSGLDSNNNVDIYLSGAEFKNGGKIFAGFPTTIREVSNYTGENTIHVEKDYQLHTVAGFRKLDIKQDIDLTVTNVLNHKGGINVTEDSGEVSLNGNSTLTIPTTSNVADRQAGWISSKGKNNKIVVNKGNYLSLTSKRADDISSPVVIDFKNLETDKTKSTLLKYETNKSKANVDNFAKGTNLPSKVILKENKTDGTVYMEEDYFLTVTKPNGQSIKFGTIKDGIEKIQSDTETGTYTITLDKNYSLKDADIKALENFNRNNVSFVIKGLKKETELAINNSIRLSGYTRFENIVLDYGTSTSHGIYARGHKLEMGENVTMKSTGAPTLIGGDNGRNVSKSEIIVRSGTYPSIYGGGFLGNSGVNGNINIELYGGEIKDGIYAGSRNTGEISGGQTTIKLVGGSVSGTVSGTSRVEWLRSSNNVNIHLLGTVFKDGNVKVYGGSEGLSENSKHTGESTIHVEKPNYTINTLAGFRKLDLKPGANLTVTNVLNHKGGIRVTEDSGEISLNGNSSLTIPSTSNVADRQVGWISSKGENNKIVVNKDNYLSLTSTREDEISNSVVIDLKNSETDKTKSTLLKYERNKQKANAGKFVKGTKLPSEVILNDDKTDGTVYMEEEYFLTVTKSDGEILKLKTIKDAIEKIQEDTERIGTYTITLYKNYSLTNEDIGALKNFNRKSVSFEINGINKDIELAINDSIRLSGHTMFDNIVLDYGTSSSHGIYARGYVLEMGRNVKMKSTGGPILIGGDNGRNVSQSKIIVRSGTYPAIYGGGFSDNSGVNGYVNIELYGGEIKGDIYAGSQTTGEISGGKTTIKLAGGSVGGLVSGASRISVLESSNDVNIYLSGTDLKNRGKIYGGFARLKDNGNHTGESTIHVEKDYQLHTLAGFRKLEIKPGINLTVTDILNHKGGIEVTKNSGEVSLNGNSTLTVPSTEKDIDRQAGWISSKNDNNKIIVNKDNYLNLTSTRDDEISSSVVIDLKNPETDKTKSTLLKYETNKQKANAGKFVKGTNLPSEVILKGDKTDGTVYMEEDYFLTVAKPNGESLKLKTIKDGIKKIKEDTQTGEYTITLYENYSLTDADMNELKNFNRNNVSFVIKGSNKDIELAISKSIMLSTDTKFEDLVFDYGTSTSHGIYARGHKLEMGENVTMKSTGAPTLIGGDYKANVSKSEIIVRSGRYKDIYGGGFLDNSGVSGNINIELHKGEVLGDIYGGSHDRGKISGGKTTIKLIGGSVGGIVVGTSRVSGLDSSNNVDIHLSGTEFKNGGKIFAGFPTIIREVSNYTGENTIHVEKDYQLHTVAGFRKLDLKQGVNLDVTNVLNHKGGIRVTENSGEVSLNGNSSLTIPSTSNIADRQAGWISSKGENNRIIVNKDNYLSLTSTKEDEISNSVVIDFKNPETGKIESTLLKYETNKQKASVENFVKGTNLPSEVILKEDKTDGTVYIEEEYFLTVTRPNDEILKFKTIKDAIEKIQADTERIGTYTITLYENYSLTNEDINALKNFNRKSVSFEINGINKDIELAINDSIRLSGHTMFDNIVLDYGTSSSHGIYARGYVLEMGQNVKMKNTGGPILIGGDNGRNVSQSKIIVRSGTYPAIYGGGFSNNSGVNGYVRIELYGGEIKGDIYAGSKATGAISGGKTTIKLAGGSVGGLVVGTSKVSRIR